jgi:PAS domain S-box-containing protein
MGSFPTELFDRKGPIARYWAASVWMPYGFAVLSAWVALSLWAMSSVMHTAPFALFVAAVVVTARFAGFGPALLCTGVSAVLLDYFVFEPHFRFSDSPEELQRLAVFLGISILVGSLARQRTRATRRAEQTQQEMAAIVECSEDAIFSTRADGIITSWNRGAEMLYQYSADQAVGRHVTLIAPPGRVAEVEENRSRLNRGESVPSYQTERMRKDGSRVSVMISISPLRNAKGQIVGASAIARDISAQKRAEEALRRNEKLATAGRLAASIAHEINNPLEAVTNLIYLARHDPANAPGHLEMAERELERVAHIARQTLGFVRESSVATPLDVGSLLDEVLRLYSSKLLKKRIEVQKRFRGAAIRAYGGELRQLFSNLIVNAVEAMDPGGLLWLRVRPGQEYADGGRRGVRVLIADNGSGISGEHLDHLFEPFYTTKKDAGTGLGLWLSLGIVRKHGGSIRVRTRVQAGKSGTMFSIFLPEGVEPSGAVNVPGQQNPEQQGFPAIH